MQLYWNFKFFGSVRIYRISLRDASAPLGHASFGQAIVFKCGSVGSSFVYAFREDVIFWPADEDPNVVSKMSASSEVFGFIGSVNPQCLHLSVSVDPSGAISK